METVNGIVVCFMLCLCYVRTEQDYSPVSSNNRKDLDICSHWNGRRHFLEMGERGDLHAQNVSISSYRSTVFTPITLHNNKSLDIWYQCNLELVTCAECVIRITFTHTNFSRTCEKQQNSLNYKQCPCEHIEFSEPPYDQELSGQEFCGDGKIFRSKTRTLLLKLVYRASSTHVFSLQYFSERNVKIISGSPKQSIVMTRKNSSQQLEPHVISTPYFPLPYPRDYGIEHILTCEAESCRVRLDFTDFQLGLTSTMEIFDSNGQMLDSYTGEHFRPPIVISSGKSLLLQFRGNGVTGPGFRAEITFVSEKILKDKQLTPYTDCGGMVTGPGGAITMMNMIENITEVRNYDCIWIIKPSNNYIMMKTHISLRVDSFYGLATASALVIRQGTTSTAPKIETVTWPGNSGIIKNHIVPITSGYYIRLTGIFGVSSKLAIVYSVFNYLNCYIGSEFLCNNNHCISIRLRCDGFDHCGDGSDEPSTECEQEWEHIQSDRRWYSHKPNYYFPKNEQYPDLKTATGIFVISTLGIIAVLSGWMVILYRMGIRARHQRNFENHLQTISEFLDRQDDIGPTDTSPPPDYEAPPDYEEVIKVGMENEINCTYSQQRILAHQENRTHRSNANQQPSTSYIAIAALRSDQSMTTDIQAATSRCEAPKAGASAAKTSPLDELHIQNIANTCISRNSTITPFDESSVGFQDNSLNISLSLALPSTSIGKDGKISAEQPRGSNICNESTHLKKSWITFNNPGQYYRVQRLRHTFSTPDSFLANYSSLQNDEEDQTENINERSSSIFDSMATLTPTPTSDKGQQTEDFNLMEEGFQVIGKLSRSKSYSVFENKKKTDFPRRNSCTLHTLEHNHGNQMFII